MMALELAKSKRMTVTDIIEKDLKKNYNNVITLEQGIGLFKQFMEDDLQIVRVRNTLFVIDQNVGSVIYYHTINAEPLKSFLTNCHVFFSLMKKQDVDVAICYFNKSLLKTLTKYKLPNEDIKKSDDLKQGDYMVITYLNAKGKK